MRTILAGLVVAALGFASGAAAADLATRTTDYAAPPATAVDWDGYYAGVEGGGAWGTSTHTFSDGTTSGSHGPFGLSGGLVGGTLGYNWRVGSMVAGLEGDLSWAGSSGSTPGVPAHLCTDGPCTSDLTWLGTARGRIGFPIDKWLPYLTAGLAFGNVQACEDVTCSSDTHVGWTVGGGIEARLTAGWSAKAEYLYVDLGNVKAYTLSAFPTFPHREDTTENIFRIGLNHTF